MKNRLLRWASSAALSVAAFSIYGTICRTWFYEPPIASKFRVEE